MRPASKSTSFYEMPRISERRAPVTAASRIGTSQAVPRETSNRAPSWADVGPVELWPLDHRALHQGYGVARDQPVRGRLAERGAQHAADLGDRSGRRTALLHAREDCSDLAGSDLHEFKPADDRHDLPADVSLVSVKSPGTDPSSALAFKPAHQVVGQGDSLGTGIASSFDEADDLVQGALRLSLGGKAALALLASATGDRVAADVDDELPRAALPDVSPHWTALLWRLMQEQLTAQEADCGPAARRSFANGVPTATGA
jgi:hypothetical protein